MLNFRTKAGETIATLTYSSVCLACMLFLFLEMDAKFGVILNGSFWTIIGMFLLIASLLFRNRSSTYYILPLIFIGIQLVILMFPGVHSSLIDIFGSSYPLKKSP